MAMMTRAALVLFVFAPAALPCSCFQPNPVCSSYWNTPLVFSGRAVSKQLIYDDPKPGVIGPGRYEVAFMVTESLKGDAGKQIVIRTHNQSSACGFDFEDGQDYIVFAYERNGEWWTSICSLTHRVKDADDSDLKWIHGLATAPPGATIFGHIGIRSQGDDEPPASLAVTLQGPQSRTVTADQKGDFSASGLTPGTYQVSAAAPAGYAPFDTQKAAVVDRGCAEVLLSTKINGRIRGHVYFADGTPAANINLTLENALANPKDYSARNAQHRTSAADGSFEFSRLDPEVYILGTNVDFPAFGSPYYRKTYYPAVAERAGATRIPLAVAQLVDDVRFELPKDAPPPSIPVEVTFVDRQGKPLAGGTVIAEDSMWENSAVEKPQATDSSGKGTVLLRKGSYYDIGAYANTRGARQTCAEPLGVLAADDLKPITLVATHPFGNCRRFKKPRP
jgi:hypothetical protein